MASASSVGSDDSNLLLAAALAYARRGWPVVPVHHVQASKCSCPRGIRCKTPGKHPRIANWTELASCDEQQIRTWWQTWPNANVGIATSGLHVVLDFDKKNGGLETLEQLQQEGDLGNPLRVKSGGGGGHLYYTATGPLGIATSTLPGLDILAEGRLVVAPPSVHASGKAYEFNFDSFDGDPDDLKNLYVPGPMPEWLLQRLREARGTCNETGPHHARRSLTEDEKRELLALLPAILRYIPADDRTIWLQIGMALHHALGNEGFELWAEWSRASTKFDAEDQQRTWDSFGKRIRANPITLGTLFHLAREHGFTGAIPGAVSTERLAIVVSKLSHVDAKALFTLYVRGVACRSSQLTVTSQRSRATVKKDLLEAAIQEQDQKGEEDEERHSLFEQAWTKAERFANQVLTTLEPKATDSDDDIDLADLSPARIEEEKEKARRARDAECDRRTAALSEEERQRAIQLGRGPDLLQELTKDVGLLGHVGEDQNAAVLLLVYASCRLEKPLHALVLGQSSAGKSHLCSTVAQLFPSEWVMSLTEMTPKFLAYLGAFEIAGKIIVLGERPLGDEEQVAARNKFMREMIEQGYATHGTVEADSSGKYAATRKLVLGPIASSETTTKDSIFAEDQNRRIVLESDPSEDQTKLILTCQAEALTGDAPALPSERQTDIHNLLRMLKRPQEVHVPFARMLAAVFPKHLVEVRRLFPQVTTLICVNAFLHQMQREAKDQNGEPVPWDLRQHGRHTLVADPRDYETIAEVVNPLLGRALRQNLSAAERQLLEQIQQLVARKDVGVNLRLEFTTPQICKHIEAMTGREQDSANVRKRLRVLESHKLIELIEQGGGQSPNRYRLLQETGPPDESGWQLPATYAALWEEAEGPEALSPQAYSDEDWAAGPGDADSPAGSDPDGWSAALENPDWLHLDDPGSGGSEGVSGG